MLAESSLERYVARAVHSADTAFERLVFLGSLRDFYTGRYIHDGWTQMATPEDIHRVVEGVHQSSFESVLHLTIIELCKQLRFHFRSIKQPELATCNLWLETQPFRILIPSRCSPPMRELFVSNIQTALEVLQRAPQWPDLNEPVALLRPRPAQSPLLRSTAETF
jgi:hypothetical protein